MKVTEAVRRTVVTSVDIHRAKAGDALFPRHGVDEDCDEVWQVMMSTQSGMLPIQHSLRTFESEDLAQEFVARHTPGTYVEQDWSGIEDLHQDWVQRMIDAGSYLADGADDGLSPLGYDVLVQAGVLDEPGYGISQRVREFIGKSRLASLQERYGENWSAAVEYEYCCLHFPTSSPAYVAACSRYHFYITGNDYVAGYLWRDLECLVYGVETAALKSAEMRQKAGEKGSAKSTEARAQRRSQLMQAMEAVARRNPDVAALGDRTLANMALPSCVKANPSLWKQGRGQVEEYLREMRLGEAGGDLKWRYAALFPSAVTPPRPKTA